MSFFITLQRWQQSSLRLYATKAVQVQRQRRGWLCTTKRTVTSLSSMNRDNGTSNSSCSSSSTSSVFWCGQIVFGESYQHQHQQPQPGSIVVDTTSGTIVSCHVGQSRENAKEMAKNWRPVLENNSEKESSCTFHDLGSSACLSPGLIDVHTHISALGRDWEGYESATRAACAGGITTCIAMPLNSMPATTTVASFEREREQADKSVLYADVGLWGGAVPRNCNDQDLVLTDLLQAGCWGLKAFLSPLPATAGFESVSPEQLLQAAIVCGQYDKPLLVHAELMSENECADALETAFANAGNSENNNPQQSYQAHLDSRPAAWERAAIQVVSEAASSCRMHIVHLSDADSLDVIRTCKADPTKKQLTVETCPHYLLLDSSIIQDGETRVKCFPPIRDAANREKLWEDGIRSGLIDIVASDHSPCTPEMRCMETGNMRLAWGGLSGLQYQLPATWTEAFARGFSVVDMAQWWSRNPSLMAGLEQKGSIAPGKQADLCWWDPSFEGAAPNEYSREYHRWKDTTYYADNSTLRGRVLGTWVRGVHAYDGHQDKHLKAAGEFLVG